MQFLSFFFGKLWQWSEYKLQIRWGLWTPYYFDGTLYSGENEWFITTLSIGDESDLHPIITSLVLFVKEYWGNHWLCSYYYFMKTPCRKSELQIWFVLEHIQFFCSVVPEIYRNNRTHSIFGHDFRVDFRNRLGPFNRDFLHAPGTYKETTYIIWKP